MSRSNPEVQLTNPAKRFFEWKGDTGTLAYYDKDQKVNIDVALPFRFLVLDEVVQVGGGIKRHGKYVGYFSNAIRSKHIAHAPLIVKSRVDKFTTIEAEGVWSHIKGTLQGSKYVKGLYVAFIGDDKVLQIGFLKFKGAANSAWIEFNNANNHRDVCQGAYTIKARSEEKENGNTIYYEPVFGWTDKVSEESEQAAVALDQELQAYLEIYFAQSLVATEFTGESDGDAELPMQTEWADEPPADWHEEEAF